MSPATELRALRRHDLAWVAPAAGFELLGCRASTALETRVRDWIGGGHPLVVARQTGDARYVTLAVTLLAGAARERVACRFLADHVQAVRAPLALRDCLGALPPALAQPLDALAGALDALGVAAGVYGSLSWEILSGQRYRHPESDLDLICDLKRADQLPPALTALAATARVLPCALDGELRFPSQDAVAWRELAAALGRPGQTVLVKGRHDVRLRPLAELLTDCDAASRLPPTVHA